MQDYEYQEFLQWLEFKRQRNQETIVVSCEQPEVLLEQDFDTLGRRISRGYPSRKDVRRGGDRYNDREDACIVDLRNAGWKFQDIGEILGRTGGAIGRRYDVVKEN